MRRWMTANDVVEWEDAIEPMLASMVLSTARP